MKVETIKCPNCGGSVQMNAELEKGFCMYCGGAILVKDEIAKIKVVHSGKVEIDDSKKLNNSIILADRAFQGGNFNECYNYCCAALECDVNNYHATFRKGLCAAYISLSRVYELEQSLATAVNLINSTSPNADNDLYIIFCELFDFIKATYVMDCQRAKGFSYPNLAAANSTFSVLAVLTKLIDLCAQLITEPMMQRHPTFENDKRICLEHGLQFCEDGMSPLKYFAGYQQVQRGNSYVQEETFKKATSPSYDMHKFYSDKFKTDFNNLPTTRSALMGYDSEIAKLQSEIDAYTLGLDAYLNANPALKKAYHKSVKPFLIPLAALFTLFVIYIGSYAGDFSSPKFLAIAIIASLIIVALGILTIVYAIRYSNERTQILNSLPRELSYLKNIHDQSQQRLRTVNQQKAAFLKTNTKR